MSATPAVIHLSSARTARGKAPTGVTQVHTTKQGRVYGRPINARVVDEYPIELELTTLADLPAPSRVRRSVSKGMFRKNGAPTPGWGSYVTPGTSKFPFGDMQVGNSFFIKLFDATLEELSRVRKAVNTSMYGHIRRGHLPTLFSLSSVFAEKDGQLGVAFFRIS